MCLKYEFNSSLEYASTGLYLTISCNASALFTNCSVESYFSASNLSKNSSYKYTFAVEAVTVISPMRCL